MFKGRQATEGHHTGTGYMDIEYAKAQAERELREEYDSPKKSTKPTNPRSSLFRESEPDKVYRSLLDEMGLISGLSGNPTYFFSQTGITTRFNRDTRGGGLPYFPQATVVGLLERGVQEGKLEKIIVEKCVVKQTEENHFQIAGYRTKLKPTKKSRTSNEQEQPSAQIKYFDLVMNQLATMSSKAEEIVYFNLLKIAALLNKRKDLEIYLSERKVEGVLEFAVEAGLVKKVIIKDTTFRIDQATGYRLLNPIESKIKPKNSAKKIK